jgi:predicted phage tail component-like protein
VPSGKGYTITFDGVSSLTIPEFICSTVKRSLVGERRHTMEEVPGREGAWWFEELPGMRRIEIEGHILADSFPLPRRGVVRQVARWIGKTNLCPLIISDDPDVFEMAALANEPAVEEWRERGSFKLDFQAMPYSYSVDIQEFEEVAGTGVDAFVIESDGDVFSEPIIEITAAGSIGAGIEVELNGRTLIYGEAIAGGATITINCISKTLTLGVNEDTELTGYFEVADLDMENVVGQFGFLNPGTNTLNVDASVSGYTVRVLWRDKFQ